MGNIVKELKKGNQTLAVKVRNLEFENKLLREERNKLLQENHRLKHVLSNYKCNTKQSEHELINYFGGMFSKVLDTVTKSEGVE